MARKVVNTMRKAKGSTGRWLRRWGFMVSLAVVTAAGVMLLAVHDTGQFELEGDATHNTLSPPLGPTHDWDQVFADNQTNPKGTSSGAVASTFSIDGSGSASIFTGGGSKDPQDLSQWAWKDTGGLPDKDNLLHAFGARYSLPNTATCPAPPGKNCEVLYFGSDRFDNSGDAQQGFWFLQGPASTQYDSDGDGTVDAPCPITIGGGTGFCDPTTGLAAHHTDGDILIISHFSNGGDVSTIDVFLWSGGANGTLTPGPSLNTAKCGVGSADPFCGIVNPAGVTTAVPWSSTFLDKSGNSTTYAVGEFFEGGLNLSSIPGASDRCFSSLVAETRSSTSPTATLKDFVVGQLASCSSGLTTTPTDGAGAAIPAGGLSIGPGQISVKDSATLTVNVATWSGTLKFFLCGPIASGTCTTGGTQIGPAAGVTVTNATPQPFLSDAATISSAGRYCWRGEFTGTLGVPNATDASVTECFVVNPVQPGITTDASADPPTGVPLGTAISDTATLSGTATSPGNPVINGLAGAPAGGTITFNVYGPDDATCANAPAFTSAALPVAGNGTYGPASFTPTLPGTYRWVATYTGNSPNTLGVAGGCNDTGEASLVISLTPTVTTAQFFYPNDAATVTVASGGGNLAGSVRFRMFTDNQCATAALIDQSVTLQAPAALTKTVETTNTSVRINSTTTVYWKVDYTSTNPAHTNASLACGKEQTTLTINNNAPTP